MQNTKRNSTFIIKEHYESDGTHVKELLEKELYKRILNSMEQLGID